MNTGTYQSFKYLLATLVATFVCVELLMPVFSAEAAFSQEINYQGKLTTASGVAVPDILYNMNFWLIGSSTAATSSAVWAEHVLVGIEYRF